ELSFSPNEGAARDGHVPSCDREGLQRWERCRQLLMDQLVDVHRRREIAQPVLAEIHQLDRLTGAPQELGRDIRCQYLATVRNAHETSSAVQDRSVVVTVPLLGASGVESHTD